MSTDEMQVNAGCDYCVPNNRGRKKPLRIKHRSYTTTANSGTIINKIAEYSSIQRINRKSSKNGVFVIQKRIVKRMINPNAPKYKTYTDTTVKDIKKITHCPKCNRCLNDKIHPENPLLNR